MVKRSEKTEQKDLVRRFRQAGLLFAWVPNELAGEVSKHGGMVRQLDCYNRGLLPGMPDLLLFTRTPSVGVGVAIELKRGDGGNGLSAEQRDVLGRLQAQGWTVVVARGYVEVLVELRGLGYPV